jgi:hypothetical protein
MAKKVNIKKEKQRKYLNNFTEKEKEEEEEDKEKNNKNKRGKMRREGERKKGELRRGEKTGRDCHWRESQRNRIFFCFFCCAGGVHCGIYKSSYNISYLN